MCQIVVGVVASLKQEKEIGGEGKEREREGMCVCVNL